MFINFLSFVVSLYLSKIFFRKSKNIVARGKIETRINLRSQIDSNFHTYRSRKSLSVFELGCSLITIRYFRVNIGSKNAYVDKKFTKNVRSLLKLKKWITVDQKKLLTKHVDICRTNLFALSTKKGCLSKIFYIMEFLLNNLLFQVYAVEIFSANKKSQMFNIDNKISKNISENKLKLLSELKSFRNKKYLPSK